MRASFGPCRWLTSVRPWHPEPWFTVDKSGRTYLGAITARSVTWTRHVELRGVPVAINYDGDDETSWVHVVESYGMLDKYDDGTAIIRDPTEDADEAWQAAQAGYAAATTEEDAPDE